jgi:hypothetical protein
VNERKPQPGDKVRVTIYYTVDPSGHYVGKSIADEDYVAVEVLEPADDPSKDPVGTLRREEKGGGFAVYVKAGSPAGGTWVLIHTSEPGVLADRFPDGFVAGFPVVGSVPGTPAAEDES